LAIAVLGFEPFGRLVETFGPKLRLSLPLRQTPMSTVRLSDIGSWREPRPKADYVALSCKLPDESEYTLAIRASDGDLDRLRSALKTAGVAEF
jgi:hypothetical protein